MRSIELSEVSALAPHLQSAEPEPLFLTKNGQTVGAVVPVNDDDVESLLLSISPQFQAILERSQERFEMEGGMSSADVRKRLGLPAADK